MELAKISQSKISIDISKEELGFLINALNEVCNKIEKWEFYSRLGFNLEQAKETLKDLDSSYNEMKKMDPKK